MTPIAIKKLIVNKNMKHYNFDEVIERHGTSCVKFDRLKEMFDDENLIPLWVADMDFRTPDFIVEALKKRCEPRYSAIHSAPTSITRVSSIGYTTNITGKYNGNGSAISRES